MGNKVIYVAGGCFWGVENYFKQVKGLVDTEVGYANYDTIEEINYEIVCRGKYNAVEAVKLTYDTDVIDLKTIMDLLFLVIDPTLENRQGNDRGIQYRTGIYYTSAQDKELIEDYIKEIRPNYKTWYFENVPLTTYKTAEDYHQDFLEINKKGYCHINMDVLPEKYKK